MHDLETIIAINKDPDRYRQSLEDDDFRLTALQVNDITSIVEKYVAGLRSIEQSTEMFYYFLSQVK